MRRILVTAAVTALVASFAFAVVPALAHDYGDRADVSLHRRDELWRGHVKNSTSFCENHRKVVLRKRGPDGSVKIVSGETDSTGFYAFDVEKTRGPYYVVAKRKVKETAGHRHVCKVSISNEVGHQTWS